MPYADPELDHDWTTADIVILLMTGVIAGFVSITIPHTLPAIDRAIHHYAAPDTVYVNEVEHLWSPPYDPTSLSRWSVSKSELDSLARLYEQMNNQSIVETALGRGIVWHRID